MSKVLGALHRVRRASEVAHVAHDVANEVVHEGVDTMRTVLRSAMDVGRSDNPASPFQTQDASIVDIYSGKDRGGVELHTLARGPGARHAQDGGSGTSSGADSNAQGQMKLLKRVRIAPSITTPPVQWLFLCTLGMLTAILCGMADSASTYLLKGRELMAFSVDNWGASMVLWTLWTVIFACIAASIGHLITPHCEGSGVPQIKSILSGTPNLGKFLTMRVLIAKLLGIIIQMGSGLSVGKEGPWIHTASCLANQLVRVPGFRSLQRSGNASRNSLAAAVASGVTAVMGAPVGGVIFSVEITSTVFVVRNLWRAFTAAVLCAFTFQLIGALSSNELFHRTVFPVQPIITVELISFAFFGLTCGLWGGFFVRCVTKALMFRKALVTSVLSRYLYTACIAMLVGICTFPMVCLQKGWDTLTVPGTLAVFFVVKFLATLFCVTLPIPAGIFAPLVLLGSVWGRLYGEVIALMFPNSNIWPGVYAVVGAAALVSGATQSVSTAVILFELTGQLYFLLPMLIATLISFSVAGTFSVGAFDALLSMSGLPYLPKAYSPDLYKLDASEVMHRDVPYLTLSATYSQATSVLNIEAFSGDEGQRLHEFPIVDNAESMMLIGAVTRDQLEYLIKAKTRAAVWEDAEMPLRALLAAARQDNLAANSDVAAAGAEVQPDDNVANETLASDAADPKITLDAAPFELSENTPMSRVHFIFATCLFTQAFVTSHGKLRGVILTEDLSNAKRMHELAASTIVADQ